MGKTILVLGGGIGGINTAKELNRKIGNEDGINLARILVFEKDEKNVFGPSLTWLMVGKREMEEVYRDTKDAEIGGLEIILGDIESVDPENISVTSGGKKYEGDYMVVSLGVEQSSEYNLGLSGHNFYTLEGAASFYDNLKEFKGGKITIVVPSLPYKSPVAPYEATMLVENYIREHGLRDKTEIALYTPESEPMPFAGKEISVNVKQLMESKGVQYNPNHQLVSGSDKTLVFKTDSEARKEVDFSLMAYTPKHDCPAVIKETGLVGESGWIEVNRKTMETDFPNVYAIGDITAIRLDSGETLPKAGVFAQYQGHIVAHNIARDISGKSADESFEGEGEYILELGGDKAQKVKGNFYEADVDAKKSSMIRHWEKVLFEKSWFIKNF
jgi:sulfide:quinone oxidoreductase